MFINTLPFKQKALAISAIALLPVIGHAQGDSEAEVRIQKLEQQVQFLLQELEQQKAAPGQQQAQIQETAVAPKGNVVATTNGRSLVFKSVDNDFSFQVGGRLQADAAFHDASSGADFGDGTAIRRLFLDVRGTVGQHWSYRYQYDFSRPGGSDSGSRGLRDAWIQYTGFGPHHITVGNFKAPLGLEHLASGLATTFIERGVTDLFSPDRRLGIGYNTAGSNWSTALGVFGERAEGDVGSEVANALYTSQSGVSKHIKDLEDELGVELYIRKGKRLLGLTEPGKAMIPIVSRMLLDASNIRNLVEQFSQQDSGQLTLATTHTQARYALPQVVTAFKKLYPKVHLKLHQGSPAEIAQALLDGEADIGIATETLGQIPELASFPYYRWHHDIVVPEGHPLTGLETVTLAHLAEHPIITYHEGFTGRARVEKAFSDASLVPDIVLSALDADVIKSYVELGMGVGIIASVAFAPQRDQGLVKLDGSQLFEASVSRIAVRRGHLLRRYAYRFIELCSAELSEADILAQVAPVDPV